MNDAQKLLVIETWEKVKPLAGVATDLFYTKLFELDPSLQPMFKGNMKQQKTKLFAALCFVVDNLNDVPTIVSVLEDLGRKHVGYGVKEEHYTTVGNALIGTLRAALGFHFTKDVEDAWTCAYSLVSSTMINASGYR